MLLNKTRSTRIQKVLLAVFFLVSLHPFAQEPEPLTLGLVGLCVLEEHQADIKAFS
jgi:hypothetical protein